MAKRRRVERTEPSRKEAAMTKRERERARTMTIIVGAVVGFALLVLVVGLLYQSVIIPNSAVATVNGQRISTNDLWKLTRFDQFQRINQLQSLLQFQEQIDPGGEQGFFTSQIQQLQGDLVNPEGATNRVLEQMIEEQLVRQLAADSNIVVSDAEVQAELESLVAAQQGFVTAPEATATAEALAAATPTPVPLPSGTDASTPTLPTLPPEPTPTVQVQTESEFNAGLDQLLTNVSQGAGISKADARKIYVSLLSSNILREKLTEQLGDQMPTGEDQVRARHILLSVDAEASEEDRAAALSEAISLTQRLRTGEDFAELALQYSDDTGSAQQGGDLGFFTRGQMVTEFEEAAFSLPIGQISDPVLSQFGYHIIEVLEQQPGSPNFTAWLQEQKSLALIVRSLTTARLPTLPAVPPQLFAN